MQVIEEKDLLLQSAGLSSSFSAETRGRDGSRGGASQGLDAKKVEYLKNIVLQYMTGDEMVRVVGHVTTISSGLLICVLGQAADGNCDCNSAELFAGRDRQCAKKVQLCERALAAVPNFCPSVSQASPSLNAP